MSMSQARRRRRPPFPICRGKQQKSYKTKTKRRTMMLWEPLLGKREKWGGRGGGGSWKWRRIGSALSARGTMRRRRRRRRCHVVRMGSSHHTRHSTPTPPCRKQRVVESANLGRGGGGRSRRTHMYILLFLAKIRTSFSFRDGLKKRQRRRRLSFFSRAAHRMTYDFTFSGSVLF